MSRRALLIAVTFLVPATAHAHFVLIDPPARAAQASNGDPQTNAPCGPTGAGLGTPTGEVTTVMAGSTMTLTIDETVYHPGHYRVAIAPTMAELPDDPAVTGGAQCGTTTIDPNPSLPVLADGVFLHSSSFSGNQTIEIPIPAGMTCDNCVLQVFEFMTNHASPCFYYHCATVNVIAGPVPDAGVGGGADAGTLGDDIEDGGCCDSGHRPAPGSWLVGIMLLGWTLRRRGARR